VANCLSALSLCRDGPTLRLPTGVETKAGRARPRPAHAVSLAARRPSVLAFRRLSQMSAYCFEEQQPAAAAAVAGRSVGVASPQPPPPMLLAPPVQRRRRRANERQRYGLLHYASTNSGDVIARARSFRSQWAGRILVVDQRPANRTRVFAISCTTMVAVLTSSHDASRQLTSTHFLTHRLGSCDLLRGTFGDQFMVLYHLQHANFQILLVLFILYVFVINTVISVNRTCIYFGFLMNCSYTTGRWEGLIV